MDFLIVLGVFLWVMLAFWPAWLAKQKGYSFLLFLALSWLVSFVLTLVVVLILRDKNETAADRRADREAEAALEKEESQV